MSGATPVAGQLLLIYANDNRGWLFPVGPTAGDGYPAHYGGGVPEEERWPTKVRGLDRWDHPMLTCPVDLEPVNRHTYVLNFHLAERNIRYHSRNLGGLSPADIVLVGEKRNSVQDYYMDGQDYFRLVDPYMHGVSRGSNYLYMDLHAGTTPPGEAAKGIDPWDLPENVADEK